MLCFNSDPLVRKCLKGAGSKPNWFPPVCVVWEMYPRKRRLLSVFLTLQQTFFVDFGQGSCPTFLSWWPQILSESKTWMFLGFKPCLTLHHNISCDPWISASLPLHTVQSSPLNSNLFFSCFLLCSLSNVQCRFCCIVKTENIFRVSFAEFRKIYWTGPLFLNFARAPKSHLSVGLNPVFFHWGETEPEVVHRIKELCWGI